MKKIIIFLFILISSLIFSSSPVYAAKRVNGYYKPKTGTYVQPYYRSNSNYTKSDNYSTKGNYNPYTGKKGYNNYYR